MKTKPILGMAGVVLVALVLSLFCGTVSAETQKTVVFADDFSEDDVDYDDWQVQDTTYEDLYSIDDDQLVIGAWTNVPQDGLFDIATDDGYTNASVYSFTMEKLANDTDDGARNYTYLFANLVDVAELDDESAVFGSYVTVSMMYYSSTGFEYTSMVIMSRNADWEDGDAMNPNIYTYDVTEEVVYGVTFTVNRVANTVNVNVVDEGNDNVFSITIADLYEIDSDIELGLSFGGSIGYGVGTDDPVGDAYPVGNIDDVEIAYTTTVTTPTTPTVTNNWSKEIGIFVAMIGVVMIIAAVIYRQELDNRYIYIVVFGLILVFLGIINYLYGYVQTIPYILQ